MQTPQTVQLSIADGAYSAAIREAVSRGCAWHVESVDRPDFSRCCVMVLDRFAFARLPLPLSNPQAIVLVTPKDPQLLALAWEAGIVSVVSDEDPLDTVLLAIMAAALRVAKSCAQTLPGGISPTGVPAACVNSPNKPVFRSETSQNPLT